MGVHYPSRLTDPAILAYSYLNEGTDTQVFQIAGPNTNCDDNPPVTAEYGGFRPVFSPNGRRIAFTVEGNLGLEIRTVGVDGSSPRAIRLDSSSDVPITPVGWVDDQTVVWADFDDTGSWPMIYASEDSKDAFTNNLLTDVLMDCETATLPFEFILQIALHDDVLYLLDSYELWRLTQSTASTCASRTARPIHYR